MSYRLITKAVLAITNAAGETTTREVQCRAYPAPKRDDAGSITIDGNPVGYKRTGGKGRGTTDNRYMYATVKGTMCFWAITEPEATALAGGTAVLTTVAAPAEDAKPAAEQPAAEPVVAEAPKAQRRGKKAAAAAA